MSNIIILYDITGRIPGRPWSLSPSNTRFCLNYKGLAYKTVWVAFSEIEELCKSIGALHTRLKADGSPKYTLPVIHDPSTGATVSDTLRIAEYLDATYPETPRVIQEGTHALQQAFLGAYSPFIRTALQFLLPGCLSLVTQNCVESFNYVHGILVFGKSLDEVLPKGDNYGVQWQQMKDNLGVVAVFLEAGKLEGPFVMGETPSFADFFFGGILVLVKEIWGEDSAEWKDFTSWHGGRWGALAKALEKYYIVT